MELGVWFLVNKTDSSTVGGTPSFEMVCVGTGKVLCRTDGQKSKMQM